jgi:asparagine N-glycosylation enzyme membrane subunit Stt3
MHLRDRRVRAGTIALSLAAVVLGLALRIASRPLAIAGRTGFVSSDCLYHLRRARFAVAHFPRTIVLDPWIHAPEGGICIWPPLFDLSIALPARLLHGTGASRQDVERLAARVPLAYAAGAIVLAGALAALVRRRRFAAGALLLALCPGHGLYSQLGHTDQHVAESFWSLALLLAGLVLARRPRCARAAVATGVLLLAALSNWQGAIFWVPLLGVALLRPAWSCAAAAWRGAVFVFFLPAALLAIETAYFAHGAPLPFTYVSFGGFQPAFTTAGGLVLLLAGGLGAARRRRPRAAAGLLALAVGAAGLLAVAAPQFLGVVARGIAHLWSGGATAPEARHGLLAYEASWLSQIFEYRPLFSGGPGAALGLLTFAFVLSPTVIVLWAVRARKGAHRDAFLLLAAWGAFTFLFTLSQRRNVYYAAPLAVLAVLEIAAQASARLLRRRPRRIRLAAQAAVVAILWSPAALGWRDEIGSRPGFGSDLLTTLAEVSRRWSPSNPYDPRLLSPGNPAPPWTVLAPWSLGHLLTYYGEVPVVADNFGYGFRDSIDFFLARTEEDAIRIARRHKVKLVFAADLVPKLNDYAAIRGEGPLVGPEGPKPEYFLTMQSRLYDFDGLGLSHFRLVLASRTGTLRLGRFVARWKVFEVD